MLRRSNVSSSGILTAQTQVRTGLVKSRHCRTTVVTSGSTPWFKSRINRRLPLRAAAIATISGAELTARYPSFGEPLSSYSMRRSNSPPIRINTGCGHDIAGSIFFVIQIYSSAEGIKKTSPRGLVHKIVQQTAEFGVLPHRIAARMDD